jgi:hypothetical protein
MDSRERGGDGVAVAERRPGVVQRERSETEVAKRREYYAVAGLLAALKAGYQEDPEDEAHRQFQIGYAAGVLGAVRFREMLTRKRA